MKLATLCYIVDKLSNKTLMLHRIKKQNDIHEGKWSGLGGKMEPGESPEDCIIREVAEECGLKIKNPKFAGLITEPLFDGVEDWYVFVFTAEKYSGELIDTHEGVLEWIPNEKLLNLNLWEGDRIFMDWIFREKLFSAKFIYENGELKSHEVFFY